MLQTPGREVQSVAQASFDAWVKYYRQDENTANATVSYYTKGALVALCFDLTLRAEGQTTLDDVMRALWQRCKAGPMTEADFAAVLQGTGRARLRPRNRGLGPRHARAAAGGTAARRTAWPCSTSRRSCSSASACA